ncbi:uncharacterized protein MONBRDRAFT_32312 [Monosiga brevicollis MX1]|uniref:BRO1 domain-containing protein n=1 Tax=Monosiga brevicollis TaxID=81824 RepID=A9UYQ6_MONBE|nr:uncharacterized protein MONBRDRAFT_32312 [Monosiga brevicollis MX1]EDQ89503.1 predicted protein [Monosiga brevicollis MX1]|eukprot:XP_001745532.1 hypothetical protein [Monosiga brevicollis MX1]
MAQPCWIELPPKRAQHVSFTEPLIKFVANEYQQDPATLKEAVQELTDLRDACVVRPAERHESGLKAINKYYGRLCALSKRFPFRTSEPWSGTPPPPIGIKFAWDDLFAANSLFSRSKTVALEDVNYEKICVLFCIAALQSQIGAISNYNSDEGLKTAAKNFQGAASIFRAAASEVHRYYTTTPSNDINSTLLNALHLVMLAQAQEVVWRKCVLENRKDQLVAKVAKQAAVYYEDAFKTLKELANLNKDWVQLCNVKYLYFEAEAHFRQGLFEDTQDKQGQALARYQAALRAIQEADRLAANMKFDVKRVMATISAKLKTAEKENSTIYLQVVPSPDTLPFVERQNLVSAERSLPDFMSKDIMGDDPFVAVVPLAVHQARKRYEDRRDEHVAQHINQLRQVTAACVDDLRAMNLPGALQVQESGDAVPETLLAHCQEVQAAGGVQWVEDKIKNLPSLSQMCQDMLDEARSSLDREKSEDERYRQQYGAKYTLEPSDRIADPTRKEVEKFATILQRSRSRDEEVVSKYASIKPGILVMCKSPDELQQILPKDSPGSQQASNGTTSTLRELLSKLDELRTARDGMEAEFETAKAEDDISGLLLERGADVVEEMAFQEQLQRYKPLEARVEQLVVETNTVMARTKEAFQAFAGERGMQTSERQDMLSDLEAKYQGWMELRAHLTEGEKFYTNLAGLLERQQTKVQDFVLARQLEAKDFVSSLSRNIAATPSENYGSSGPAFSSGSTSQPPAASAPPSQQQPYTAHGGYPQQQQQQQQPPQSQPRPAVGGYGASAPPPSYGGYPAAQPQAPYPPHGAQQGQQPYWQPAPSAQQQYGGYAPQPGMPQSYGGAPPPAYQSGSYGAPYGQPPQGGPYGGYPAPASQQPHQQQPPYGYGAPPPGPYGGQGGGYHSSA